MCLLAALPCLAGEYAVLANGFRVHVDRHDVDGGVVRLYSGDSTSELPCSAILAFEKDDSVPPPPPPAPAPTPQRASRLEPKELVTQAALRNGLPPDLLHSIAAVESGYRQDAVSPKGAVGIMQLMPRTAKELQADPTDPEQNVDAGARYLRELLIKYIDDPWQLRKALAAYNAGPAAVDRYGGIPPYLETQLYVQRVLQVRAQMNR